KLSSNGWMLVFGLRIADTPCLCSNDGFDRQPVDVGCARDTFTNDAVARALSLKEPARFTEPRTRQLDQRAKVGIRIAVYDLAFELADHLRPADDCGPGRALFDVR